MNSCASAVNDSSRKMHVDLAREKQNSLASNNGSTLLVTMAMPLDPIKLRSHNLPPVHWFIIYPDPIGAPCRDELVNFLLPLGPLVV